MLGILFKKKIKVDMSIPLITVQGLQISQASKTLINKVDFWLFINMIVLF